MTPSPLGQSERWHDEAFARGFNAAISSLRAAARVVPDLNFATWANLCADHLEAEVGRLAPVDRRDCAHADVRYCASERGAVACFTCGRLFGHLRGDGTFVSYNPQVAAPKRPQVRKAWIGWWVDGAWCPNGRVRDHWIAKKGA